MKEKPLVTIITVVFNLMKGGRGEMFRQCLESVHNQTYQDIEHLVIDGGSKDGTVNLIREYADKGWIKYISEPDSGIYDAMNKGVKLAKGKYIAFLNSDDFYHSKQGVEMSVKALEESGADFSYAPVKMLNEDGTVLTYNHPHLSPDISNVFFVMPFCHQTMFTRRDVMIREGLFDTNFKSAGDYDFVIRLCLKKYKSIFVEAVFVTFRFGGLSDVNQEQSIREVSESYFNNYNKLINITKKECNKIYCTNYANIPPRLAEVFKNFEPYFNYREYIRAQNIGVKKTFIQFIQKINLYCFRWLLKPTYLDVVMAYSCFLGRLPEDELVIQGHLKQKSVKLLVNSFLNSEEYKFRTGNKAENFVVRVLIIRIKGHIPQSIKQGIRKIYYFLKLYD